MPKLGYMGPSGTFSEKAALEYLKTLKPKKMDLGSYETIQDVILAVNRGELSEGVVPIENSVEGTIGVVTDFLAKKDIKLKIKAEVVVPVFHYLIAGKGTKLDNVTDIISHPQGIDQCMDFIRENLRRAKIHLAYSTSDAVSRVAQEQLIGEKKRHLAAIGSNTAAKVYGLKIIASKINVPDNETRFVVLSKKDALATGTDKTSIVFSIRRDKPGGLHHILGEFATRAINLTKIESRPSKKALGDYLFFIDMQGHIEDELIAEAIADIQHKTAFFKILGSYPKAIRKGK